MGFFVGGSGVEHVRAMQQEEAEELTVRGSWRRIRERRAVGARYHMVGLPDEPGPRCGSERRLVEAGH